ncbi:MAG: ShlB/FhaC/HecB family hemolysin secretion/activation protein [Aquabacterium sp.]|uniref:ShlB/FhaC/HecB family hemolysin secretion/activation protein n=1 Tax=Aquabacterium sp. TaxID=1872578 RepID=UPI002A363421|nr:ShlB/FhaC/HecB family hemolysin secretion/activation protein [Aquabacterium sp.]MDX9843144.1 ShlB/FhaC/HecB family hemolysin secretion/activation protein [Aquabacterium sp.]
MSCRFPSRLLTRRLPFACLVLASVTPLVHADAVTPDAGQLLNQQQRAGSSPLTPPKERAPAVTAPADAAPSNGASSQELRARIQQVRFSGAVTLVPEADLQSAVQSALGRELTHAQLQQLAERVTQYLRERGYVVARAYLPRQDLTDGVLTIEVLDGRLQSSGERIVLQADTRIDPSRLKAVAETALPRGEALRQKDLERAVLLMNDVPGVSARAMIERGEEPGTSRLAVSATQAPLQQVTLIGDNFGSRSTGVPRLTSQLRLLDPTGRGDALLFSVTLSENTQALAASYSTPLHPNGLQASVSATHLIYEVGGALAPLELEGSATTAALGLSYPIVRTRDRNLYAQALLEYKGLTDDALGTNLRERRLNNLTLGVSGNATDAVLGGGVTTASLNATAGDVSLNGNMANKLADAKSAGTQGGFTKLAFNLNRFQNLGISEDWIAFLGLSGQWSGDNLDSAEKFILGGPNGVRAYPIGEAAGDRGLLATLELRRKVAMPWVDQAQLLLFIDAGRVALNAQPWAGSVPTATERNSYTLKGWGVGLNLAKDKWAVQSAVAARIGSNPGRAADGSDADGRESDVRAWLQATRRFD